jgi:hypothetical protein
MTRLLRLMLTEAISQALRLRGLCTPASRSSTRTPPSTDLAPAARFCLPAFNGCAPVDAPVMVHPGQAGIPDPHCLTKTHHVPTLRYLCPFPL